MNMAHALWCWDIVQEGMHRRKELAKDITAIQKISTVNNWQELYKSVDTALVWENKTIIITDKRLTIVYATENIYKMTGYKPSEVVGNTPKMFQGAATAPAQRKVIRTAIDDLKNFDTTIINHRKDGSVYNCHIEGYPVFDHTGELVNFIAFEKAALL